MLPLQVSFLYFSPLVHLYKCTKGYPPCRMAALIIHKCQRSKNKISKYCVTLPAPYHPLLINLFLRDLNRGTAHVKTFHLITSTGHNAGLKAVTSIDSNKKKNIALCRSSDNLKSNVTLDSPLCSCTAEMKTNNKAKNCCVRNGGTG